MSTNDFNKSRNRVSEEEIMNLGLVAIVGFVD
jgi:hypothetical protein